ncbi:conserved Plasmodium protein, unknown function [Plasmodium relictum]|uniref:Uncharacterized protein n=1 Tax=Plasmodium relictum TaxID=85471 RepID=A0A1J1H4B0_PLARL|nr:conserved Plasmodium protein, unknown function [Plasmodium relictum]CRG99742.1 conserved Plasmodium protein, unknown function [Plasmodium relictum]
MKTYRNDLKNGSQNLNLFKNKMKERSRTDLTNNKLADSDIYENINESHVTHNNQNENKSYNEENKNRISFRYCVDNLSDSTNPSTNKDYTKFYKKKNNSEHKNGKDKVSSLSQVIENKKHLNGYDKMKEKKEKKILSSYYLCKKKTPVNASNTSKNTSKHFMNNNNNSSEKKWKFDEKKNLEYYKYITDDKRENKGKNDEIQELPDIEMKKKKKYTTHYFNICDDNDINTSHLNIIKKLLCINDEQLKDVVNVSNFSIDLDINSFYYNFIKENSEYSILYYNINHNKNIYDIKEQRDYTNEKIISYKQVSSLNFGMYVCNISIQESCYFYYSLFNKVNNKSNYNLKRKESEETFLEDHEVKKGSSSSSNNYLSGNYFNNNIKYEIEKKYKIDSINNEMKENLYYLHKLNHINSHDSLNDKKTYKNEINKTRKHNSKDIIMNSNNFDDDRNTLNNNNNNNNYHTGNKENSNNQYDNNFHKAKLLPNNIIKKLSTYNIKDLYNEKENELKKKSLQNIDRNTTNDNIKKNYKNIFKMRKVSNNTLHNKKKDNFHYHNNYNEIKNICIDTNNCKNDKIFTNSEANCKNKSYISNSINCIDDKEKCDHKSFKFNLFNNLKKKYNFKKDYQFIKEDEKMQKNKIKNFFIKAFKERKIKDTNKYIMNDDICNDNKSEHTTVNNLNNNANAGDRKNKPSKVLLEHNKTKNLLIKFKKFYKSKTKNKRLNTKINNIILTNNDIKNDKNKLSTHKNIIEKNDSTFNNEYLFKHNINNGSNNKNKVEYIELNNNLKNINIEENYCSFSNFYYKDEEQENRKFLTNEYIDNNFDEIYYIQRINANNDFFSIFINVYQIYIFSRQHSSNEKVLNCNEYIKNNSQTLASIYLYIIVKSSFLKNLIKKKILNEINSCISNWKKYLIINIQNIKGSTPIPIKINNNKNKDHINNIVKNMKFFVNYYLKDIFHNFMTSFFYFFGIYENKTLENYFSYFNKDLSFVHKKNISFKNIYYKIIKNEKKNEIILENKKDFSKSRFPYLFKKKNNSNQLNLHKKSFYNSSDSEPFYITSHQIAHNYIAYINNIYFRRIILLYLLAFFFFLMLINFNFFYI